MELRRLRMDDPLVDQVLSGLGREYASRYGPNPEMGRATAADFDPPGGAFYVLVADCDVAAAGGGFRRVDAETCEIKRMWTNPTYRRQGLARSMLAALEEAAIAAGYRRLVLETGPRQPEAVALYERLGYRRIPSFGPYPDALAFESDLAGGH